MQDNKLQKFLSKNLFDELDEGDTLLNQLFHHFNQKKNEKKNILIQKQLDNTKNAFSKKLIGILINTRYVRLIHAYYIFFSNIQKSKKLNKNITSRQFGHTLFHTIYYYNKILIQFKYLSYIKNDLVKIGESILNYLEFFGYLKKEENFH